SREGAVTYYSKAFFVMVFALLNNPANPQPIYQIPSRTECELTCMRSTPRWCEYISTLNLIAVIRLYPKSFWESSRCEIEIREPNRQPQCVVNRRTFSAVGDVIESPNGSINSQSINIEYVRFESRSDKRVNNFQIYLEDGGEFLTFF